MEMAPLSTGALPGCWQRKCALRAAGDGPFPPPGFSFSPLGCLGL